MRGSLLIVEDDDGIRESLRMAMEIEYSVTTVVSAEDGLDVCRRRTMDLMLVDLTLGGMDGFAFIRRVREFSEAPIVVISARDQTVDVVSALEAARTTTSASRSSSTRSERASARCYVDRCSAETGTSIG